MRLPFGDGLRAELGAPRRSHRLGSSPRSRVWRVELPEATAVVKQIVDGADADERYAREVAALRLAARAETPVVPALLATDPGERILVLEYLDHRRPVATGSSTTQAGWRGCMPPPVRRTLGYFPGGRARTKPTSTLSCGWPRLWRFLSRLT